jgi:hypothetical protein
MQAGKTGLFLAAAAAAFGAYKYYKMTPEQRKNLKTKGNDFLNKKFGVLQSVNGKKAPAVTSEF